MSKNNFSVFILQDGTVRTVGANDKGQCCTGNTNTPILSIYKIPNLDNVKQCSLGDKHTVFLLYDGTVRTVGANSKGQCGTGSTSTTQTSLYKIPNLDNVKQVACNFNTTLFLMKDGTVKAVGENNYGQCGTGDTGVQTSLYTIQGLNNVREIACGPYHTVFILKDGTIRTLGYNINGQCLTGNTTSPQLTLYNPELNNVAHAACGLNHTVLLFNDGTIGTVGQNTHGQCATGNTSTRILTLYKSTITNVKQISCGHEHTAVLFEDGTVRLIGRNNCSQIGNGKTAEATTYFYNPNLTNIDQVMCGSYYTAFLMKDGTVKTVGSNTNGQTGNGNTNHPLRSIYTIPNLKIKTLWDLEKETVKFLIKQYSSYYTINPNYYDLEGDNFIPLELSNGTNPNMNDIINFGFTNITDLINDMTINGNTFKPINKLFSTFEIKKYKY